MNDSPRVWRGINIKTAFGKGGSERKWNNIFMFLSFYFALQYKNKIRHNNHKQPKVLTHLFAKSVFGALYIMRRKYFLFFNAL